jgi:hypothetical protein
MYWTLVDPPMEGEDDPKPRAKVLSKDPCMSGIKLTEALH